MPCPFKRFGMLHKIFKISLNLLLLDGGWTTKSPADRNKSLSLPKSICSQEVVSSCLGKDLSAWRRSTNSGTDYSGRDHITVKYCFWITRLVKKHSYSVSELPDGLFCARSQRTTTRWGMDFQKSSWWNQVPFTPKMYLLARRCQQLSRQRPERKTKEPNLRYWLLRSRSYNNRRLFLDHSTCHEI